MMADALREPQGSGARCAVGRLGLVPAALRARSPAPVLARRTSAGRPKMLGAPKAPRSTASSVCGDQRGLDSRVGDPTGESLGRLPTRPAAARAPPHRQVALVDPHRLEDGVDIAVETAAENAAGPPRRASGQRVDREVRIGREGHAPVSRPLHDVAHIQRPFAESSTGVWLPVALKTRQQHRPPAQFGGRSGGDGAAAASRRGRLSGLPKSKKKFHRLVIVLILTRFRSGAQVQFMVRRCGAGSAVPVVLGDRFRVGGCLAFLQRITAGKFSAMNCVSIAPSINDVRDVQAFGSELTRHALRQRAQRMLGAGEGAEARRAAQAGGAPVKRMVPRPRGASRDASRRREKPASAAISQTLR